jgi:redox-sensitive bicupin YhaK (pirin superfamily)
MSRDAAPENDDQPDELAEAVDVAIAPRKRDIGGFEVGRVLPSIERRMVGPFVFLDAMGPAALAAGTGLDVRPHPHIGLSTVTYLFEGEIVHRDSLGTIATIRPGEVNWMTAGRGIAHSERTGPELRKAGSRLHGVQAWVALPQKDEETEPSFDHYGRDRLPVVTGEGVRVRLIAGSLFGVASPVKTYSELFYADAMLEPGAALSVPAAHEERALYAIDGALELEGQSYAPAQLLVLNPGRQSVVKAPTGARFLLLGGAHLGGPRHIWWNFVSSRVERIAQAKADWKSGRFAPVVGDPEFIPLPD